MADKILDELNRRYVSCGPNAGPVRPGGAAHAQLTGSGMLSEVRLREGRA
ncbi:hypothetical protein [Streptomyces plumbiresistens]